MENLHETGSQENNSIDEADDPFISPCTVDTKLLGERQVGSIGSRLVPTLGSGTNGTERDGIPQHGRTVPFVVSLVCERRALFFWDIRKRLESVWLPRNERRTTK